MELCLVSSLGDCLLGSGQNFARNRQCNVGYVSASARHRSPHSRSPAGSLAHVVNGMDPRRRANLRGIAGGECTWNFATRQYLHCSSLAVGAPQFVVRSPNAILMTRRWSICEQSHSNCCLRRVCAADALAAVGTGATSTASRISPPQPHSTPVPLL